MKPLLLFCFFYSLVQTASAQSLDYISVKKQNGRTLKNIYAGSQVLLHLQNGQYVQGPVQVVKNDSLFLIVYDVRFYPTPWGTYVRDTISTLINSYHYKDIQRVHLHKQQGFIKRKAGPILMIGGAGYLVLNILNGAIFDLPITDKQNLRRIGTAGGAFGLGYLLHKLFATDGFSKKSHRIIYVDL